MPAGPGPGWREDPVPVEDGAPTFPKRPPLVPAFEVFGVDPKVFPAVPNRPPLDAPLEDGVAPKEKAMVMCRCDQGNRQAWVEKNTSKPTGECYEDGGSCRVDRRIQESDATLSVGKIELRRTGMEGGHEAKVKLGIIIGRSLMRYALFLPAPSGQGLPPEASGLDSSRSQRLSSLTLHKYFVHTFFPSLSYRSLSPMSQTHLDLS